MEKPALSASIWFKQLKHALNTDRMATKQNKNTHTKTVLKEQKTQFLHLYLQ